MSIQFKKFVLGIVSLVLGGLTFSFGIKWYLRMMSSNTFGGEITYFVPIVFILIYFYYKILVKIVIDRY